jgi:hypothetical protein
LRTAISGRFLSVLTEIFLPASCLRSDAPPFGESRASQASSSLDAPATPAAIGFSGRFCCLAIMSEVTLEKPIWLSPDMTAGTTAAPPSATAGLSVSFSALKKP